MPRETSRRSSSTPPRPEATFVSSFSTSSSPEGISEVAARRPSASETRRCCTPSWRSRSIRRRVRSEAATMLAPLCDSDHRAVRLVALHPCEIGTRQQADLSRDGREHLIGRPSLRDERRYPPQACLLVREPPALLPVVLERGRHGVERAFEG